MTLEIDEFVKRFHSIPLNQQLSPLFSSSHFMHIIFLVLLLVKITPSQTERIFLTPESKRHVYG